MYASYRCNGLSIPRLIYRAIGRFIFSPEIYRVGKKKKKKKPIARSVIPTDVLLSWSRDGRDLVLELVLSQPTLGTNRVHSCSMQTYFPQLLNEFKTKGSKRSRRFNRNDLSEMFNQSSHELLNFFRTIGFRIGLGKNIYGDPWQFGKMYNGSLHGS